MDLAEERKRCSDAVTKANLPGRLNQAAGRLRVRAEPPGCLGDDDARLHCQQKAGRLSERVQQGLWYVAKDSVLGK